ncbi:MAG: tetratricopeptide repeat protein [Fidelibacterota bacterium]|nr:MAG: tetratricopeptide repeat protein [Candidatus Neomarinimicrobiota bacterium]
MNRAITTRFVIIAIMFCGLIGEPAQAVSRLSYSRPGAMMRVPMSSVVRSPYLFSAGFVSEVMQLSPYNSANGVYFDSEVSKNMRLGMSSVSAIDTTLEIGFHIQHRLWAYGNISFSAGIHDIVLSQSDGKLTMDSELLSFLGVISSEQTLGKYYLNSYMGFGTGALAGATAAEEDTAGGFETGDSDSESSRLTLGVYAGFLLKTPMFASRGGLDIIGEFDGSGVNVGLRLPITTDYRLQIGFVHIESLPDFGGSDEEASLSPDGPALVVGLDLSVPRLAERRVAREADEEIAAMGPRVAPGLTVEEMLPQQLDSTLQAAEFLLNSLRDSLRMANFEVNNLHGQVAMLEQQSVFLSDSVRSMQLRIEMMKSNINYTMRHLSSSLRSFYQGNYRDALQDVEMAIQLNPDLAIAYARRGSIYYKLGDIQRATINWNLALKLDPEYDDVRNILRALKENRLKTTSLKQQQ